MEVLRFIKWQWNRTDRDERFMGAIILAATIVSAYGAYAGYSFLIIFVTIISTLAFGLVIWGCCDWTRIRWNMYKKIKEREAEDIMRKLRGNDGSVTTPGKGFF